MAAGAVRGLRRDLGRGQREDQPAVAGVDRRQLEDVSEEGSDTLRVGRIADRVGAGDHAAEPSDDQTSILVATRLTTSVVNSLVPAAPPRSGVLIPDAIVSSAAS